LSMTAPPVLRPAATLLLLRDGAAAIEVLMLRRHEDAFFSGALVFPGGRVDDGDGALRPHCRVPPGLDDETVAYRIAAIRESYEEAGILAARVIGDDSLISAAALAALEQSFIEQLGRPPHFVDIVTSGKLELAIDALVPYAHWVTPERVAKRYDTRFFLAHAPADQVPRPDGQEAVAVAWLTPAAAFAEAEAMRERLIFATRLNLARLARSATPEAALAAAAAAPITRICPEVYDTEGGQRIRIPEGLGYDECDLPLSRLTRG